MDYQPSKTDSSQESGATLPGAPARRQLGIRFAPAVAFAVCCQPANTKPADRPREGGSRSMKGTCYPAANPASCPSEKPGNTGALGPA